MCAGNFLEQEITLQGELDIPNAVLSKYVGSDLPLLMVLFLYIFVETQVALY